MKAWLVAAFALAVGAVAVLLVWPGPSGDSGAVPEEVHYVALGDSFSAGPLVPEARNDPAGCLRSTNNYPAYLAGYLDVTTYRDVTCSGAQTRDLRTRQQVLFGARPSPQLDAVSEKTDLVTLGIGGNDFGLFGSLIGTCSQVRGRDPDGAPCRRTFSQLVAGEEVDTKSRDARRIQAPVVRVLREVQQRAPDADVYVVGYPRLLPDRGTCRAVPFATGDYAWGRQVQGLLNRSLQLAAERAGATYVDLFAASRGHDACAGDQAWVNGARLQLGAAANFHPFQTGMRGMAQAIFEALTGESAPATRDASPPAGSVVLNQSEEDGE